MTVQVIVIGGGVAGLAAALRLRERLTILGKPYEVHLLEASGRVGGVIATFQKNDFLLEAGPDSFISEKRRGVGLCQDLGIMREIIETNKDHRRSLIAFKGHLHPVPDGFYLMAPSYIWPTLMSPLLSFKGKLRMFKEYGIPLQPQEDESVGSFVRRRLGDEVLTRLAQPLLSGIYSADPDKLSLRATFPQFLEMEKRGGVLRNLAKKTGAGVAEASGARYKLFVTLKSGMQSLVDTLAKKLGPLVHLNVSVSQIEKSGSKWRLTLNEGQTMEADAVCIALPAPGISRLASFFDSEVASLVGKIPYTDSITANFALKESDIKNPLNGFGFVVPEIEKRSLSACTFVHRKFPGRAPKGYALLRAYAGGKAAAALWNQSDADIQSRFFSDLKALLGITGTALFSTLQRYKNALPQYAVGHLDRLKEIDAKMAQHRGLALAGNWRRGVGVPDCIESGEDAADSIVMQLCQI